MSSDTKTSQNKILETATTFETLLEKYQTNPQFCVGNSMTIADLDLLAWYVMSKDIYFGFDFAVAAPVSNRIVMGLTPFFL